MTQRRALMRSLLAGGAVLSLGASARVFGASGVPTCPTLPEETSGPFPADGSQMQGQRPPPGMGPAGQNWPKPPPRGADREGPGPHPLDADGHRQIPNILAAPGIVRKDLRASFDTSATVAAGIPLRVQLTLLDRRGACTPLVNSAIYLWSCNRDGDYSLYGRGVEHENYLRGVQFTDSAGRVDFQTIFPACYSGRYPHLHLEIFRAGERALNAGSRVLTTQLTAPREICSQVYERASGYARSAAQFKALSPRDDMVFASSSAAELDLQTLTMSGDVGAGFEGRATIGL